MNTVTNIHRGREFRARAIKPYQVPLYCFKPKQMNPPAARSLSRPPSPSGRGRSKRDKATTPRSRAKRDFNRAAMRERSKWERETVSNTPDQGFRSSTAPGWRRGSDRAADGTYAVATLLVAWSGLRSVPPQPDRRKNPWFWQDGNKLDEDRDSGFSVFSR